MNGLRPCVRAPTGAVNDLIFEPLAAFQFRDVVAGNGGNFSSSAAPAFLYNKESGLTAAGGHVDNWRVR